MANEARRTLTQMLTAVRTSLDETVAAYWTDANLMSVLTRAAHAVGTEIRKLRADYWLRPMASTDISETIYGETYAPSSLAIVAGTTTYTLPPDLLELKMVECITSGYETVTFVHKDLAHPSFRSVRAAATSSQSPSVIYFDLTGERSLILTPPSDTALNIRIWYVSSVVIVATSTGASLLDFATSTDQLIMPWPGYMAVEEVATMRAQLRDHDPMASAWASMADQSVNRLFGAHGRVTQDPVVVQGLFE
jgi:hypothetical protein